MRKKILVVSSYFPYPAHDGGKVRIFNLIKFLSKDNDISLLSYVETAEAGDMYRPFLEQYCKRVITVIRDERNRLISDAVPRSPTFNYTPEMIEALERTLGEVRPDIIQIEFLIMSQYVNHIKGIPVIYTEHDMSSIDFEQSFHDRDMPEKERFVEWTRLVKYQKEVLRKFNGVIVLTERDRNILEKFTPGLNPAVIPTGVDIDYYKPPETAKSSKNIAFIGHYRHYPNYDGVEYFMKDIWPSVKGKVPDAKFYILGSGADAKIRRYQSVDVIVDGPIEDLRTYLKDVSVFVAPVRLGGGIKGKILEAMASGVPVVATAEACAGISCSPGNDILKADDPADFAAKTINLLNDEPERRRIAVNARKLVEEQYDWNKICIKLDLFYDSVITRYKHAGVSCSESH